MIIRSEIEMIVAYAALALLLATGCMYAGVGDLFVAGGIAAATAFVVVGGIMTLQARGVAGGANFFGGAPVYVVVVEGPSTLVATLQAIREMRLRPVVMQAA